MMDESDVVASCENIHKTYLLGIEGVPALRGVSADVYRRDLLVIYGTSGGGKSTLLNVFGTIDVPTKGNLNLFRKRITERTPDSVLALLRCKKVGFVFQSFNLLSTMNAIDNVCLPMIIAGDRPADQIRARAKMLLDQVGLGHRLDHFPSQMSGGEQQRVTIARALANEPEMLLLDEPTGDLDTRNTHRVLSILLDLNLNKGLTMAMVTHDVYMKQYATRVLYLRDGRVNRIETMDPRMRLAAVEHLKTTVEKETLDSRRVSAQTTVANETRMPADYDTFSARADGRTFFRHENPYLFQKLFGAKRDGFQAVLLQQQQQLQAAGGGVSAPPGPSGSPQPAVVNVPASVGTPAHLGSPYPPAAGGAVGVDRSAIAFALANASTAGGGGALSARRVPLPEDPKDAAYLRSAQGRSYEQFQGHEMGAVSAAGIVPGVTVFGPAGEPQQQQQRDVSALMAAAARSMVATATDAPGAVQHLRTASLRVAAPVSVHMTMPSQHAAAALREAQAHHLRTLSGGMQVHATGVYGGGNGGGGAARTPGGGIGPAEFATPIGGVVMAGGAATAASSQQTSIEGHVVQRANTTGSFVTTVAPQTGTDSIWVVQGSPAAAASPLTVSMTSGTAVAPRAPAHHGQTPNDAFSASPA